MDSRLMMQTDNISLKVAEGVARLTLERPEIRNALAPELERDMMAALEAAETDDEAKVVTVSGGKTAFSAGGYIKSFDAQRSAPPIERREAATLTEQLFRRLLAFPKPLISVIHGYALGGGFALALCADVVLSAQDARLGFPEVSRGFVPAMALGIACQRLPAILARELILTAESYRAETLARRGAGLAVLPGDELGEHADQVAGRLANMPVGAVRFTKELLELTAWPQHDADLRRLSYPSTLMRYSAEFADGVDAFYGR